MCRRVLGRGIRAVPYAAQRFQSLNRGRPKRWTEVVSPVLPVRQFVHRYTETVRPSLTARSNWETLCLPP